MTHALLAGDPDPIDRQRACDLGRAGLPDYCATIAINSRGEEVYLLAKYSQGEADYIVDWASTAPHEEVGRLPSDWRHGLSPRPRTT